MFLLYLDESGVPEPHPDQTSHYVVVGIAVHEGTWFALERLLRKLKKRYGLEQDGDWELHAAWILSRFREQERVSGFADLDWSARHKAIQHLRAEKMEQQSSWSSKKRRRKIDFYKQTEPYIHLTSKERKDLVRDALTVVSNYRRGLYLFGEAINKETLSPAIDPVRESFSQLIARFERFLKSRKQKHWGLVTMDQNPTQAKRLNKMLADFQRKGTRWTDVERVIESPFFVDSSTCAGVQVADLCAYALRRYVEKNEIERFELIFPKFFRQRGKLHGLRHFTEKGCSCLICEDRSHR